MKVNAVKILKIFISTQTETEVLKYVEKYLKQPAVNPLKIVTPNPEQLMLAETDNRFAEILNQADIAIPDGVGIVWAARTLAAGKIRSRITGVDVFTKLVDLAHEKGVGIGLIGGRHGLAISAFKCLSASREGLLGFGLDGPELELGEQGVTVKHQNEQVFFEMVLERIRNKDVRIIFIGLGAPKQEYFMERLAGELERQNIGRGKVLMVVGGAFDMIAGRVARAPKWMQNAGLEWFWRLLLEPWRIIRQLALLRFILTVRAQSIYRS